MKKKNFIYLMIFSVGLMYGCKKNKPTPGGYIGEFTYTNTPNTEPFTEFYTIIRTYENHIEIARSEFGGQISTSSSLLQKDNKKVTGSLISAMPANRQIDGVWEKKKGKYIIKGTFTQSGASPFGPYTHSGTFELKSR